MNSRIAWVIHINSYFSYRELWFNFGFSITDSCTVIHPYSWIMDIHQTYMINMKCKYFMVLQKLQSDPCKMGHLHSKINFVKLSILIPCINKLYLSTYSMLADAPKPTSVRLSGSIFKLACQILHNVWNNISNIAHNVCNNINNIASLVKICYSHQIISRHCVNQCIPIDKNK